MNSLALDVESLSLSVGGTRILNNVSARVLAGETWSILGANGAGKSTLLKCLMRIHTGWSGQVNLFGRSLRSFSQRQLARRVAYVPQASGVARFPYTVREFVRMGRYAYAGLFGSAHPDDGDAIARAMAHTGAEGLAERTVDTLSGGERQKVFIAAALAQEADILLLDEPAAFLDYRHQAEVYGVLRAVNRESGLTILTVTHDVNAALLTGGHALALRDGEVAYHGPSDCLADEGRLAHIFGTTFRFLHDPVTGGRVVAPQGGAI